MTLLDRYISKRFLQVLFFSLFAFLTVFVVVNMIEKMDDFLNQNVPKFVIMQFYLSSLPYFVVLCLPISMLLASLFSVGNMTRQNEIMAMKASGISLYRIFLPLYFIGFLVSIGAFYFGEYVVPYASEKREYIKDEYMEKHRESWRKSIKDVYARDNMDRLINIRSYNTARNVGRIVSVRKFEGDELVKRIDAKTITWKDSSWILHDGYQRSFPESPENTGPFREMHLQNCNLTPKDFAKNLKLPEEMSSVELGEFIKEVERNGSNPEKWLVDYYLKFSFPLANLIIVLFGAPFSSQTRRGSAATGFGISLLVCFVYFGIVKTSQAVGHNGYLPPLIAAWLANIVFLVGGVFVTFKAPK